MKKAHGLIILCLTLVMPLSARCDQNYLSWAITDNNNQASIHLQQALHSFHKKTDVVVAVIDTGIDPTHPYIAGNLWLPGKQKIGPTNFGRDFSKGSKKLQTPYDKHGHGTHIAGIIKGIFKDVKILALKYYTPMASGEENLASTIEALKYAIRANVDIINYSGGGPEASIEEKKLLEVAKRKGILVVAASGNEESNIDIPQNAYYPASYGLDNILTVTAHDQNQRLLPTSNYGKRLVDISGPGERIKSSLPNDRAGFLTGTSQATAFATGIAALIKASHPEFKALEIKQIIIQSAHKTNSLAQASSSGGSLDAVASMKEANNYKSSATRQVAQAKVVPGQLTFRPLKKK